MFCPYEYSSVTLYLGRIAERARLGGGGLRHRVPGQQARSVRVQPQTCRPGSSPGRHTKYGIKKQLGIRPRYKADDFFKTKWPISLSHRTIPRPGKNPRL